MLQWLLLQGCARREGTERVPARARCQADDAAADAVEVLVLETVLRRLNDLQQVKAHRRCLQVEVLKYARLAVEKLLRARRSFLQE